MRLSLLHVVLIFCLAGCSSIDGLKKNFDELVSRESKNSYIVQLGDSVWSIAIKYNLDPQSIIDKNHLLQPYTIFPNQNLQFSKNGKASTPKIAFQPIAWHHPLNQYIQPEKQGSYWLVYKERKGKPIYSIDEGKVVVSGPDIPGYGNLIMISHANGFLSLYAHCDKVLVQSGDTVKKGMIIAQVGNSESPESMLRFQLRKNGKPVKTSQLRFNL